MSYNELVEYDIDEIQETLESPKQPHDLPKVHVNSGHKRSQPKATPHSVQITELHLRNIAQMFSQALPVEGKDYKAKIDTILTELKRLSPEAKTALRSAYIFAAKAPREEREDLFQDLALAVLKQGITDEKLGYAIARCDWLNWWEKRYIRSEKTCTVDGTFKAPNYGKCTHSWKPAKCSLCGYLAMTPIASLDADITDSEGDSVTVGELLIGEAEFEAKICGKFECSRIWKALAEYPAIRALVVKRFVGKALTKLETETLARWSSKFSSLILS